MDKFIIRKPRTVKDLDSGAADSKSESLNVDPVSVASTRPEEFDYAMRIQCRTSYPQ